MESGMLKLRRYLKLPVFIEEDHHDVVPHIHRAIASRHLPMTAVTLVHFDSHPDLLLPLNMDADLVYNKEDLYSMLSIENWILPLVYAGHVSEIYWLRAPWAQQLPAGQLTFGVGKCKDTGKLRMTCPDPYFLTEALYAPESHLLDMKTVSVHVITITPDNWGSDSNSSNSETLPVNLLNSQQSGSSSKDSSSVSVLTDKPVCSGDAAVRDEDKSCIQTDSICVDGKRKTSPGADESNNKVRKTETNQNCHNARDQSETESSVTEALRSTVFDKKSVEFPEELEWLGELRDKLQNRPYILDIDLDFFSTRDPFRDVWTPEETSLLRELFGYQLPKDHSEQALTEFTEVRRSQLEQLEKVFEALQQDPASIPHVHSSNRQAALEKLVSSVQSRNQSETTVDYQMLYHAGCTMDDTELPHHVSSAAHIQQLMSASHDVLAGLPAPTIITIARSSEDDYCPKHQVDKIQEDMLQVLQDLYADIDIKKVYEENSHLEEQS